MSAVLQFMNEPVGVVDIVAISALMIGYCAARIMPQ